MATGAATPTSPTTVSSTIPPPVANLLQSAVPGDQLQCGEFCFMQQVDFDKSANDDEQNISKVKKTVCGLGNKSGGMMTVTSVSRGKVPCKSLDKWKNRMHDQFPKFMGKYCYQACVQYVDIKDVGLHLPIKPSPQLLTVHSHLFIRNDSISSEANEANIITNVLASRRCSPLPGVPAFPCQIGGITLQSENKNFEYKYWSSASILADYEYKFQDPRTTKSILGLMNELNGGCFIVGINEERNGNTVRGQQLLCSEEDIKHWLNGFIQKFVVVAADSSSTTPYVLKQDQDYDIEIRTIATQPERLVLIILRFASFEGVVCGEMPESYTLTYKGLLRRLSLDEWRIHLTRSVPRGYELSHPSPTVATLVLPLKQKVPTVRQKIWKALASPVRAFQLRETQKKLDRDLQQTDTLSYTEQQPGWAETLNMVPGHKDYEMQQLLQDSALLKLSNPVNFIPAESIILKACPGVDVSPLSKHIKAAAAQTRAMALAQMSCLHLLPETEILSPPPKHILDMLVVTSTPDIQLWVVVSEKGDDAEQKTQLSYTFQTARLLKYHFLQTQTATKSRCSGLSISCRLYSLPGDVVEGSHQSMISECFRIEPSCSGDTLRSAIAEMLLSKDTWLKDAIESHKQIRMTADQIEVILCNACGVLLQFSIIEGPPGSGKTFMGLALAKMFGDMAAWIVSTNSFKEFLNHKGVQIAHVVTGDTDLLGLVSTGHLLSHTCVIVDDAHNFNCSLTSWQELFEFILKNGIRMFLLIDSKIQNYTENTDAKSGLRKFCRKNNIQIGGPFSLTKMHRNTQKIAAFIQANAVDSGLTLTCANEQLGHDVEIRKMANTREHNNNDLVKFLKAELEPRAQLTGSAAAYSEGDISILVDGTDPQRDVACFTEIIREKVTCNVQDASVHPVRGIIVDTVANFMGLDSKMCLFVVTEADQRSSTGSRLSNPKYRAFLASRAVYRVVFVVENLTSNMARTLQFGDLQRRKKTDDLQDTAGPSAEEHGLLPSKTVVPEAERYSLFLLHMLLALPDAIKENMENLQLSTISELFFIVVPAHLLTSEDQANRENSMIVEESLVDYDPNIIQSLQKFQFGFERPSRHDTYKANIHRIAKNHLFIGEVPSCLRDLTEGVTTEDFYNSLDVILKQDEFAEFKSKVCLIYHDGTRDLAAHIMDAMEPEPPSISEAVQPSPTHKSNTTVTKT